MSVKVYGSFVFFFDNGLLISYIINVLMTKDADFFLGEIKNSIRIATGCTEPVAIALNTATARKHTPGTAQRVEINMEYLAKNGMGDANQAILHIMNSKAR
ncbi:hypothetical protein AGMMS49546_31130 [Spirochaetia bacterium]|nr:hypothetical protein AGMMS49546_31130 [Spirochaetia bacterium]